MGLKNEGFVSFPLDVCWITGEVTRLIWGTPEQIGKYLADRSKDEIKRVLDSLEIEIGGD